MESPKQSMTTLHHRLILKSPNIKNQFVLFVCIHFCKTCFQDNAQTCLCLCLCACKHNSTKYSYFYCFYFHPYCFKFFLKSTYNLAYNLSWILHKWLTLQLNFLRIVNKHHNHSNDICLKAFTQLFLSFCNANYVKW